MAIQERTGVRSAAANGKNGHTLISDAKFRQLYALALGLQLRAQHAGANGRPGTILPGREAMLAGVAADLRAGDALAAEYGDWVAATLHEEMPNELSLPVPVSSFADQVIGLVSSAVAERMRKSGRVTTIFLRGGSKDPVIEEAQRMAAQARLPILFVEDAAAAQTSPVRQKRGKASPPSPEMPSIPVDSQDVIAIYRVAHESIARAREDSGPTRIVCLDWQASAGVRKAPQPAVENLERWLAARGLPLQQWRQEILSRLASEASAKDRAGLSQPNGSGEGMVRQPQSFASAQTDRIEVS